MTSGQKLSAGVLIWGLGSVGERHLSNISDLGFNKITVIRSTNRVPRISNNISYKDVKSLKEIDLNQIEYAFICTPSSHHFDNLCQLIENHVNVYCEKPAVTSLEQARTLQYKLEKYKGIFHVGYMKRYHPFTKYIKNAIADKKYGGLIKLEFNWGEYLPDWHPWEDHKKSYAANKVQGGGTLLTLSHEVDQVLEILGEVPIKKYLCTFQNTSIVKDVDSMATILLLFKGSKCATIHLDFHRKTARQDLVIYFEKQILNVDFLKNKISSEGVSNNILDLGAYERNSMFNESLKTFLSVCEDSNINKKLYNSLQINRVINIHEIIDDEYQF